MKRTRHIEITRYSRRITVIQGERAVADTTEEQQVSGLILDTLEGVPSAPSAQMDWAQMDWDRSGPNDVAADHLPRRRSFFRLGDLLRLRKRT